MILYPTETVYGLGVNVFDPDALALLYTLKGRDIQNTVSWLVRDASDVERYTIMSPRARNILEAYLPGPLTLVLPLRREFHGRTLSTRETVGIRISSDPVAKKLIQDFMQEYDAPLTCTSANKTGLPTLKEPRAILEQFDEDAHLIGTVVDDGPREGLPSTVVEVIRDTVRVIRTGSIATESLLNL